MAAKPSLTEVIEKFRTVHGGRYNYDAVKYINASTHVVIGCSIHGEFRQQPRAHCAGQGCPRCNQRDNWVPRGSLQHFITRANQVHSSKYDYSKTVYTGVSSKLIIVCRLHGEFKQKANGHLNGQGCPTCAGNQKLDINAFIKNAVVVHGSKYNYSKAVYCGISSKLTIICPIHGEFQQQADNHLAGKGCCYCGREAMKAKHRHTTATFIKKAKSVHGDRYDYTPTTYSDCHQRISIICKEHGVFWQLPRDHTNNGHGCPHCAGNSAKDTAQFIAEAETKWGDRFTYNNSDYINRKATILVTCVDHGDFHTVPQSFLKYGKCPRCAQSNGQRELDSYIRSLYSGPITNNNRITITPYEIDIYLPELKLGIEYHGEYFHSSTTTINQRRHSLKADLAVSNDIQLIQIFEKEWKDKPDIVKSIIAHKLGQSIRIYARTCSLVPLAQSVQLAFCRQHHLQGGKSVACAWGLYYNGGLISCMTFNRTDENGTWMLDRYVTKLGHAVVGGAGKLFKAFIRTSNPTSVITFADRRFSTANVYMKLGFKLEKITRPNYWYWKGDTYKSRISCQKHKLHRFLDNYNPQLSERANMINNGYRIIWDAGHYKLLWTR